MGVREGQVIRLIIVTFDHWSIIKETGLAKEIFPSASEERHQAKGTRQ